MNQPRRRLLPKPMASDRKAVNRRIGLVGGIILAGLLGVTAKAHQIAVVDHDSYA